MARKLAQISLKPFNEITLTPLIALSFLVLAVLILVFSFFEGEQEIPVRLPKGSAGGISAVGKKHAITVDKRGEVCLDGTPIGIDLLSAKMTEMRKLDPSVAVLVQGDGRGKYADVVKVLKVLDESEVTRVTLDTEFEANLWP